MANNDQILDDKARAEIPIDYSAANAATVGGGSPENNKKKPLVTKTLVFSTIVAVLFIVLIAWYFLFSGKAKVSPTSENVALLIKGPDQLVSDNEAEYDLDYTNGENADMINVSMEVLYPSGFTFKSSQPTATSTDGTTFNLPIVKSGQNSQLIIRGKLTGGTGEDKQIKAVLHYSLSNFNSEFAVTQTLDTSILPPNLTMDLNGPVDVVNGQDTTFTLNLTNVTNMDFAAPVLQMTYPDGFEFTSSNPAPSNNNNYWALPTLPQNSSTTIEITGSFTGNDSEVKLVKADLGQMVNNVFAPQLTSTATFMIIPSSLGLTVTSDAKNSIVNLGDVINYSVKYANQGTIGLNNLVIAVNLQGPALDLSRLSAQNAIVSGSTLTWKAGTLPALSQLAPNETGVINFSVPVTQNLTTNLKNQTIKASSLIYSDEITKPTKAADVSLKLASKLAVAVTGAYVSGAAPMQVGQTTLFAMTFALTNLSNDLSDTKVVATLPLPASAWNNVIVPDSEKNRLSYDPNSGKITWDIGDLAAFTGKFIPALKVTFQLEVVPGVADHSKVMNLLSHVTATGTDTFTQQMINANVINNVSSSDINDPTLNSKGTTVQ